MILIYSHVGAKKRMKKVIRQVPSSSKILWFYNNTAFISKDIRRVNETHTVTC